MTVPYEVTGSDMSRLFIPEGECNGQGSRHVVDGCMIRVMPCKCETCEEGKAARKIAWDKVDDHIQQAKDKLARRETDECLSPNRLSNHSTR